MALINACKEMRAALAMLAFALSASVVPAALGSTEELAAEVDAFNGMIIELLSKEKANGTLDEASAYRIIKEHGSKRFDFDAITRTAMGKNWRKTDDEQRAELTETFTQLLEKIYSKALARFQDEKLLLEGSAERKPGVHSIRLTAVHEEDGFDIEYLVNENDGDWRIFDVKFEGVSLISSYRGQFSELVRREGVDGLIAKLRERVAN